jgi:hypothetical protein
MELIKMVRGTSEIEEIKEKNDSIDEFNRIHTLYNEK